MAHLNFNEVLYDKMMNGPCYDPQDILMKDGTKHPLSDYIKEYNKKYAGKSVEEVRLQEELLRDKIITQEEFRSNFIEDMKETIVEAAKPSPDFIPMINFLTNDSSYCGLHNTVDDGGCKVCKEHG